MFDLAEIIGLDQEYLVDELANAGIDYISQVDWRKIVRSFGAGLLGDSYKPSRLEEKYLLVFGQWLRSRTDSIQKDRSVYKKQVQKISAVRRVHTIRALRAMDPKEFEYWSAGYFMDRGFRNVRIVPPGPDFGLDIYMTCPNGKKAIVQCKKYAAKHLVDRPVIQQTFGVMHLLSAKKCYVVTTSSFTRDALELGQRKDIVLLDGAVLASERSARIKTRISIAKKTVDHSKPTNYKKKA